MDCTGDTVVEFGVQLGKLVAGVDARLGDVPHSSSFDNVPDHELPDRLVLGDALGAVGAADILDVAPAVLVASVVPPLGRHLLQTRVIIIKGRQRHTFNLSLNTARQFHIII